MSKRRRSASDCSRWSRSRTVCAKPLPGTKPRLRRAPSHGPDRASPERFPGTLRVLYSLMYTRTRMRLVVPLLVSMAVCACAMAGPVYPLKQNANGRFLVDQHNTPFLMLGDAPQSLIVNLSDTDAASYFLDRQQHGFNSLWVNLLCTTYTGGRPDSSTIGGVVPFTNTIPGTSSYDLSTPNPDYFAHADRMIKLAATYGLQIILDPIETGGYLGVMRDNGTVKCRAYGQYVGNRYKGFPNILWMSGNDFQSWRTASDDAVAVAVAQGILAKDRNHLHSVELNYLVSSSRDDTN